MPPRPIINMNNGFTHVDANGHFLAALQHGPIKENGVNGIQITEVIQWAIDVITNLDHHFPCRENALTITKLEEALHWQHARTRDRIERGVEGVNAP